MLSLCFLCGGGATPCSLKQTYVELLLLVGYVFGRFGDGLGGHFWRMFGQVLGTCFRRVVDVLGRFQGGFRGKIPCEKPRGAT